MTSEVQNHIMYDLSLRDRCRQVYEFFWRSLGITIHNSVCNGPSGNNLRENIQVSDPMAFKQKIDAGNHNLLRISRALRFGRLLHFNFMEMYLFLLYHVYDPKVNPEGVLTIPKVTVEEWHKAVTSQLNIAAI